MRTVILALLFALPSGSARAKEPAPPNAPQAAGCRKGCPLQGSGLGFDLSRHGAPHHPRHPRWPRLKEIPHGLYGFFSPDDFWGEEGPARPIPGMENTFQDEQKGEEALGGILERYEAAADGKEKARIETEIRNALSDIQEARIRRQELEAANAAKTAERLKKKAARRRKAKDRIVERRLRELLGTEDELSW